MSAHQASNFSSDSHRSRSSFQVTAQNALFLGALAAFLTLLAKAVKLGISLGPGADWHVYNLAAEAVNRGADPYTDRSFALPFTYPPVAIPMVQLLARLGDGELAARSIALLFGLSFAALVTLWSTRFLPDKRLVPLLLFSAFPSFNFAPRMYFIVGNIGMIEILLIYIALTFALSDKILPFCALIFAVTLLKIYDLPLFFIPLLWDRSGNTRRTCIGFVVASLVVVVAEALIAPKLFAEWIANASAISREGVDINPSSYAFFRDVIVPNFALGNGHQIVAVSMLYGAYSAILVSIAWRAYPAIRDEYGKLGLLMLGIFLFSLLLPRYKNYLYIMDIPTAVFAIAVSWRRSRLIAIACFLLVMTNVVYYQPFIALLFCFAAFTETAMYSVKQSLIDLAARRAVVAGGELPENYGKGEEYG